MLYFSSKQKRIELKPANDQLQLRIQTINSITYQVSLVISKYQRKRTHYILIITCSLLREYLNVLHVILTNKVDQLIDTNINDN